MSRRQRTLTCTLVLLALAVTAPALAQTGGYTIETFSVDGGGGTSSGGGFTLSGTIGQPEADTLAGGAFTLTGGFWGDAAIPTSDSRRIYLPFVQR